MSKDEYISSGLFDLQVNGYACVDFNDPGITPQQLDHALSALLADGVTTVLPTIITASQEDLMRRFSALDRAVVQSGLGYKMIPGYHLEGPFLNAGEGYCGCHQQIAMTDAKADLVFELERGLSRPILLVTLAPERDGALAAISALHASGKTISIGHSSAGYLDVEAAVVAGATLSTHLGNGLPEQLPKLENTLLAQLSEDRLSACLIADGHHISPSAFRALLRLKGADRSILVSDAVLAAAASAGKFCFAGHEIFMDSSGRVSRADRLGLAGSSLRLDKAVRNVVTWGCASPDTAISMASVAPRMALARSFSIHGIIVDPGVITWDADLMPKRVQAGSVEIKTWNR